MLNLQRLGHGSEAYYLDQVVSGVEDYYGEAGEAPGYWLASSNYLLGLDGMVDADDLRAVLSGVDPSSGEQMHRAANRKVPGWDLTRILQSGGWVIGGLTRQVLRRLGR